MNWTWRMRNKSECTRGSKTQSETQIKPGYLRKAAAKHMNVSVRTLSDWTRMRLVAHIKPSNRVCLFRVSDLDAALSRFRTAAVGEAMV